MILWFPNRFLKAGEEVTLVRPQAQTLTANISGWGFAGVVGDPWHQLGTAQDQQEGHQLVGTLDVSLWVLQISLYPSAPLKAIKVLLRLIQMI